MNVVYKQSVLNAIEDERTEAMRIGKVIDYIVINEEENERLARELLALGDKPAAISLAGNGYVTLRGIRVVREVKS